MLNTRVLRQSIGGIREVVMARIAIDMDEVIADALGGLLDYYNRECNTSHTPEDLVGKKLTDILTEKEFNIIENALAEEEFWLDLKVMDGAQDVIERLSTRHEIFISTAAMEVPVSLRPKFHWLQEHFPCIHHLNYIFCGHKYIVRADYLIDDNPRHFSTFEGQGILFDSPHNRFVEGYPRARSWHEIEDLLLVLEESRLSGARVSSAKN